MGARMVYGVGACKIIPKNSSKDQKKITSARKKKKVAKAMFHLSLYNRSSFHLFSASIAAESVPFCF